MYVVRVFGATCSALKGLTSAPIVLANNCTSLGAA